MIRNIKITIITLIYFFLLITFWKTISADESYVESRKLLEKGKIEKAIAQANRSIEKNPEEPRYYYNRAKIYLVIQDEDYKQKASDDLKKAEDLNESNLVTLRNMVPIYYLLSLENLKEAKEIDPSFKKLTENYYQKLHTHYSNDIGLITTLYKYEEKLGMEELLIQSTEKINEFRPDLFEWYLD